MMLFERLTHDKVKCVSFASTQPGINQWASGRGMAIKSLMLGEVIRSFRAKPQVGM